MASQTDIASLDTEMALWMEVPTDAVHAPGTHYVEWPGHELNGWLGYNKSFFAFMPIAGIPSMTITSSNEGINAIRALGLDAGEQAVMPILNTITDLFKDDDCYAFDILAGSVQRMNLMLDPERVSENEPMDTNAMRWDGQNLADEVDGTIFSTSDELGMTAWAGIKRRNGPAWDFQVGTRDDARQQGLARLVSSHVIQRLQSKGITPFYAHERSNTASAALARSLGFEPYAIGIMAEHRDWIPVDER